MYIILRNKNNNHLDNTQRNETNKTYNIYGMNSSTQMTYLQFWPIFNQDLTVKDNIFKCCLNNY